MKKISTITLLLAIAGTIGLAAPPVTNAPTATSGPRYFGGWPGALAQAKTRLAAGDPALQPALDSLIKRADAALHVKPPSVTHKTRLGASGDPHDYYSQAPYLWPDPKSTNGLPYIRRDGEVNPESRAGVTDQNNVELLGSTVVALAQAYYFTGDEQYAAHAARCLRVWFLDPATRMNPNMNQGQAVPGENSGRPAGLIESGGIIEAGDAAGLLAGSTNWPAADNAALHAWLGEFLDWLRNSKLARDEAAMKQNHGTIYDAHVARLALALDRPELAKEIIEAAKLKRIAVQIEPDGSQPMELKRTKSFNYSRLNLGGLCSLAMLGEYVGVDLWHFKTADGRSLRRALEFMYPYVSDASKKWPYQQIASINRAELAGAFHQAAIAYREPRYEALARSFPGSNHSSLLLLTPTLPLKKL